MRRKELKNRSAAVLAILAVMLFASFAPVFSSPSGQTWNVEGGGFCDGTFTLYNNTIDNLLYAQNCATGANDFAASSDFGALFNSVMGSSWCANGCGVHMRAGEFNVVTTATFGRNGVELGGTIGGIRVMLNQKSVLNGTVLMAKSNAITIIQASTLSSSVTCPGLCAGAPIYIGEYLHDFVINSNGKTSIVGIDFRMAETSTWNHFSRIGFITSNVGTSEFTTAMFLDGNEDTYANELYMGYKVSSVSDLQWIVPFGNINILQSLFGSPLGVTGAAQTWAIEQSTLNSIKLTNTVAQSDIQFTNNYLANALSTNAIVNLNGFNSQTIGFQGNFIFLTNTLAMLNGGGTVANLSFNTNVLHVAGGNWATNAPTLTKQVSAGSNNIAGGCGSLPAGFPFAVDGNCNF